MRVTRAERTRRRDPEKPAVIKCQLGSVAEKITVLRNKLKIKDHDETKRVFIAKMKSHEERLIELNFKSILRELPNGNNYRMTGSGRLIDRREDEQVDAGESGGRTDEPPAAPGNDRTGRREGAWQTPRRNGQRGNRQGNSAEGANRRSTRLNSNRNNRD